MNQDSRDPLDLHGVCISATESIYTNEKAKAADPFVDDGIGEQSIPALTAPYIHTAREGVEYLGKLISRYGNADAGNGVIFGDRDEVWYMEIYAGHQWAAVKIPDDCYVIAPNDGRIGEIDVTDKVDREAWHAAVHGVAKSRTLLSSQTELNRTS